MEFLDVHEQTRYKIVVSRPENLEELSDMFISEDEFKEITGEHPCLYGNSSSRTYLLRNSITAEVEKLCEKLDASGKKSVLIEDEELLDVLRDNYVSDFVSDMYRRHGDRICYKYMRKKKKPTRGDVRNLWHAIFYAFSSKYGVYPPHVPIYERHLRMFKAFKKIVGWKYVNKQIYTPQNRKWFRQIWDNPEEYMQ